MLATASNDTRVWDIATGEVKLLLNIISCDVAFSPDGNKLAATNGNAVRLWDVTTNKADRKLKGGGWDEFFHKVSFSPNGQKVVSASHDANVLVWDATTGKLEQKIKNFSKSPNSISFLPYGSTSHPFYSVDISNRWVTRNGVKIIYLPLELEAGSYLTRESILVIGSNSGRLKLLRFHSGNRGGTLE